MEENEVFVAKMTVLTVLQRTFYPNEIVKVSRDYSEKYNFATVGAAKDYLKSLINGSDNIKILGFDITETVYKKNPDTGRIYEYISYSRSSKIAA